MKESTGTKISRRRFLAMGGLAVMGTVAASATYFAANDESQDIVVEKVTIPIKNLHPALEGFTISQMADFHLRPFTKPPLVEEAVAISNSLSPDLVVLSGDYVWKDVDAIFELAPILSGLNGKHGVYASIGNHDLWTDIDTIRQGFADARIPILQNEGVTVTEGAGSFFLAGLDDGWSGQPDLDATLATAPPNVPIISLMHEPDYADDYAEDGRIALQLSGHTHGGQIRFPRLGGALILPPHGMKYDMGLYQVGDMWLYTNRGIGVTNEPVRYNCPPEITQITLVSG